MRVRSGRNNQVGSHDEASGGSCSETLSLDPEVFIADQTLGFQPGVGQTVLQCWGSGNVPLAAAETPRRRPPRPSAPLRIWPLMLSTHRCGPKAAKSLHPEVPPDAKPSPKSAPEPYIPQGAHSTRPTGWSSPHMQALQRRFSSTMSVRRRICQIAGLNIGRRRINAVRFRRRKQASSLYCQ